MSQLQGDEEKRQESAESERESNDSLLDDLSLWLSNDDVLQRLLLL